MTEPYQSPAASETPQAASTAAPESTPAAPQEAPAAASDTAPAAGDTYHDDKVEVGDIVVDSHNRPVLVLDVNDNEGGAVTGVAFNLDGTTEVVTERPDDAAK